MKIHVTERHIRDGVRNGHCRCPVALALIEAGATYVSVDSDEIVADCIRSWIGECWSVKFVPPWQITEWIWAYDEGADMAPITFDLPA